MPDVTIDIGGRQFSVSCQEGEEHYLQAAAQMLNKEAETLSAQIGNLPESRMLLMAGLMLADKTAGMEDNVRAAEQRYAVLEAEFTALRDQPREAERIEVPVIPQSVGDTLSEIAARAEDLASRVDAVRATKA